MSNRQALYLHVPFCRAICGYCDFARVLYRQKYVWEWMRRIKEELDTVDVPVKTIYVGGGTPSALNASDLNDLLKLLERFLPVDEFTVEANPDSLDAEKADILYQRGVNRVSLGVQSFDEGILKTLERKHRAGQSEEAIAILRNAGITNLSIDLMYSLPGQTMELWKKDLEKAVSLDLPHISFYSLTIEENSRFAKEGKEPLDNDTEFEMYRYGISYLKEHGYHQYEISNFAKDGYESLHNQAYWDYEDWAGIGAGASGKQGNLRYTHTGDIRAYIAGQDDMTVEELSQDDLIFEAVMMGLRLNRGISRKQFLKRFGADPAERYAVPVLQHQKLGNLEVTDEVLRVTDKGRFILNDILTDIME